MSKIGKIIVQVHLLEDTELDNLAAGLPEVGMHKIEKVGYFTSESRIYINDDQYFSNVSDEIWNYQVGGYRICYRWLQERLGRKLGSSEQTTFMRIVGSIRETIRLQEQIGTSNYLCVFLFT